VEFENDSRLADIGQSAFSEAGSKSIVIPSSLVHLGQLSFWNCKSLNTVVYGNDCSLERIEESTFRGTGLKSIKIPPRVTFVDASAFAGISLEFISISPDNRALRSREGFLETCDRSMIFRYFGVCRSVVIPSSVVVLGKESFRHWSDVDGDWLEYVVFEEGSRLERIEESAFRETMLHSIVIPRSVVVLGKSSFTWCKWLESVVFENGSRLERIEALAFQSSGLKTIKIPSSVVSLGPSSFGWCRGLESVVFESGSRLECIEKSAFERSGLKSIQIPPGAAAIDPSAFDESVKIY
jgi:hypothetical protein